MNRKALLAGILVSLVGVVLLFLYMQRYELEASGGEPIPVLMVTSDLGLGEPLSEAVLAERMLPERYVEDRHVRVGDKDRVLGIRTANGLRANQSLLWSDLATAIDGRRDLSGLLRPGMRAITITVARNDAIVGLLRPGDRVDLLFTAVRPGSDEKVTITLLQNLLILAVGTDTGGDRENAEDRPRTTDISIATTLEQATLITHARTDGELQLTLRNPDDIEIVEGTPEFTNDDLIEPTKRDAVQTNRPPAPTTMAIENVGGN